MQCIQMSQAVTHHQLSRDGQQPAPRDYLMMRSTALRPPACFCRLANALFKTTQRLVYQNNTLPSKQEPDVFTPHHSCHELLCVGWYVVLQMLFALCPLLCCCVLCASWQQPNLFTAHHSCHGLLCPVPIAVLLCVLHLMDLACSEDMRAEMEAAAEARKRAGEEEEGGPAKRSKGEPLGADVIEVLNEVGGVCDVWGGGANRWCRMISSGTGNS